MTLKINQIKLLFNNVLKGIKQSYNKRLKSLIPLNVSNVSEIRRPHSHKSNPYEHIQRSSNFLTKKYSVPEILQSIILAMGSSVMLYLTKDLNDQISTINSQALQTTKCLDSLEKEVARLKKQTIAQKSKIADLEQQLSDQNLQQEVIDKTVSVSLNPDLLAVQNEMSQFYIKTAGYVLCGVVVIAFVYYITSTTSSLLSVKGILPGSVYRLIQNNTPFCQEKVEYTYFDRDTETGWLISIINNRKVDLKVKPNDSPEYMSLSEWLSSMNLQQPSATEASLQVAEAITSKLPTDISSVPSGTLIDIDLATTSVTHNQEFSAAVTSMAEHIGKMF